MCGLGGKGLEWQSRDSAKPGLIKSSNNAGGTSISAEDGASYSPEVCGVVSAVVNYKDLQLVNAQQDFSMSSLNL